MRTPDTDTAQNVHQYLAARDLVCLDNKMSFKFLLSGRAGVTKKKGRSLRKAGIGLPNPRPPVVGRGRAKPSGSPESGPPPAAGCPSARLASVGRAGAAVVVVVVGPV